MGKLAEDIKSMRLTQTRWEDDEDVMAIIFLQNCGFSA